MASPTVRSFSASSSGMSMSNSFSNAITSSTVSRLSAPRSSMKLASPVSFSRSTPNSSTMMSLTFSSRSLMPSSRNGIEGSLDDHAAVHNQHLARDVGSQVRRQEKYGAGHVVGATQPPERNLL